MTTAILSTYTRCDLIKSLTMPEFSDLLRECDDILFYYRGGDNLLLLSASSSQTITFNVPIVSNIKSNDGFSLVEMCSAQIIEEWNILKLKIGDHMLFDTVTKKAVYPECFINYIPYYRSTNSIFTTIKNGVISDSMFHIIDRTNRGQVKFLSMITAKKNLLSPESSTGWNEDSKRILEFLVAKEYGKDRNSTEIFWRGTPGTTLCDFPTPSIKKKLPLFATTRAKELLEKIVDKKLEKGLEKVIDIYTPHALLSDLIREGESKFLSVLKALNVSGRVHLTIDIVKEEYKTVIVDTASKIVYVTLQPGILLTAERIKQDLQIDNLVLLGVVDDEEEEKGEALYG